MAKENLQEFTPVEESSPATEPTETELQSAEETAVEPAAEVSAEQAVAEKMNEIFSRNDAQNQEDELVEEGLTGPNNPDGDTPEADQAVARKETAEEEGEEEEGEEAPAQTKEQAERQAKLDAFDANLKQIAKELGGWSQEEIDEFIAASPALAKVTFSKMAAGYNALSQQYAQGARQGFQAPAQRPSQPAVATPQVNPLDDLLANPQKLAVLQEVAGKELTEGFIRPLLQERKAMLEDKSFIANLRRESLLREINESFTGLAKSGFESFYGENGGVTQDQQNNRFKVAQLADQIRAGAQLQGVNMGINEALRRAHLISTANQTQAQARKQVLKEVKKRSSQITARPTARRARPLAIRGEDAALSAVENFWDSRG